MKTVKRSLTDVSDSAETRHLELHSLITFANCALTGDIGIDDETFSWYMHVMRDKSEELQAQLKEISEIAYNKLRNE